MQQYSRSAQTVTAFQTAWPMTITVNGQSVVGLAGEWLVMPGNGKEPYFMSDIEFEAQFTAIPVVP